MGASGSIQPYCTSGPSGATPSRDHRSASRLSIHEGRINIGNERLIIFEVVIGGKEPDYRIGVQDTEAHKAEDYCRSRPLIKGLRHARMRRNSCNGVCE